MALAETAQLVAELNMRGDLPKKAQAAGRAVADLDKKVAKLRSDGLEKLRKGASKSFSSIAKGVAVAGGALAVAGGVAFKWAADFEEQLDTINTVAKVTPERLGAIGDSIKAMSEDTGTSLDDLTGAYYDLVSAGVKAADAQGILTQANKLAIGGLSTTGEAVDLLTTAINVYNADASDAKRITDGFAQAIADGKVNASELAASFADVAPFAKDLGIEIEELQAGYALLTARGIKASQASTYMKSAIAALINPTADLQKLQAKLNIDFAELARERGLVYAYNELKKAADAAGIPLQKLTGRIEGAAFATNTGGRNFKAYNEQLGRIKRSSDGAGTAAQQMAERQKGVNAQLRQLRQTARIAAMELTEGLLPGANKGFRALKDLIRGRKQDIQNLGAAIGRIADDFFSSSFVQGEDQGSMVRVASPFERAVQGVSKAIDEFPFEDVKSALSTGLAVVKEAAAIFEGLPPPIKQGLITLLAVNKLTGGGATMIAGGLRDLAGFALKSLTTITAANVTVVGKTVTGPGGAPAPTGPGGGGGGGGATVPMIGAAILMDGNELWAEANRRLAELKSTLNIPAQQTATNTMDTKTWLAELDKKLATLPARSWTVMQPDFDAIREKLGIIPPKLEEQTTKLSAKAEAQARFAMRQIPILGDVRGGISRLQQTVASKRTSVSVTVNTAVSAVTSTQTNHHVVHTNRVVAV